MSGRRSFGDFKTDFSIIDVRQKIELPEHGVDSRGLSRGSLFQLLEFVVDPSATFPTEGQLRHNLGRVPDALWKVAGRDQPGEVFVGVTVADKSQWTRETVTFRYENTSGVNRVISIMVV